MRRSGLKPLKLQATFLIVGALLVLASARVARAGGCHVPDRPVLGSRLSWEDDRIPGLRTTQEPLAPPLLTHLPCPGEAPCLFSISITNSGFANVNRAVFDPSKLFGAISILDETGSLNPLGSRLDRPPRNRGSLVAFK